MRRSLSLLALGALTALAVGSAAALSVDGGTIQAGEDLSLICDGDGVHVTGWGLETDDNTVRWVRIGGISDNCQLNELFVSVTSGGAAVEKGSVVLGPGHTGAGFAQINFTAPFPAPADITDLHVFIEGTASTP